jgi:hypothetical protein
MHQLQVKRYLVQYAFPPNVGWEVSVHIDAMERDAKGEHSPDKRQVASESEAWLQQAGVRIGEHEHWGLVDLVARHDLFGTYIIEVEGDASRQCEQQMYSALSQVVLSMREERRSVTYGIAVPDAPHWEFQLKKVPERVKSLLNLKMFLVSGGRVRLAEGDLG